MDTIITRFESGVHNQDACGLNKSGYAAIDSAFEYTDVHKLSSCVFQSSSRPLMHSRKKPFSSSEGLVYMFIKLIRNSPNICTYVFLLSREMPISSTFKSIIEASASASNIIVTVIELSGVFSIDVYFRDIHISHKVDSFNSLKEFLKRSCLINKVMIIGYPSFTSSYIEIANSLDTMFWCAPATRHLTYSSTDTKSQVQHFVYPWSKSPLCSGFTLGMGKIGYSADIERLNYVGLYNTYETMVSSVPYGSSCCDCVELQLTASKIKCLTKSNEKQSEERHLKRSSITALEELMTKIEEYASQC